MKQQDLHASEDREPKPSEGEASEGYQRWRNHFAAERLWVLYLLGLIANPVFIAGDILLYRDQLPSLLAIRAILEVALLASFIVRLKWIARFKPTILLILWVLIGNLCIVWMTVVLGGFPAPYYNGLNLVFLAAAVIVPVSWPSHLFAQVITLAAYYGANLSGGLTPEAVHAAIGNSFFLTWTCVATLFSVYLYERLQRAEFQARLSERHARQELEASNRKLLELDRLKSEFFANISHELRTPLTLSLGAFKTLLKLAPSSECEAPIQSGMRNTSRLLFLINELLDLAKLDSGRAELRKRCIDLAALVRSIAANFESSDTTRIHLKGLSQPIAVELDPKQMKKVLYNLLSNALKFSDPAKAQVWIKVRAGEDVVELEVEDNGIGIPSDQVDRIFDRFTQVESSAARRYEGSGIGLALVKDIVALHGGQIRVESELGQGSTFVVTLPRGSARVDDIVEAVEDDSVVIPLHGDGNERQSPATSVQDSGKDLPLVLIAEDNADMRSYLEWVLRRQNRVVLAKDGVEALEQAGSLRPDLILTDVMMPRMSGYDLLKGIRADHALRSVPVIFLTARAGEEARVESLEAGADDYISKPFNENELQARVRNMIRAHVQERELIELQREKLGRFLPTHLADMIVSGDREDFLKGHRAEVTVLYIDLRGFTAFSETASPEDLMAILRQYQAEMGKLITDYNGTLEQFAGDSLMIFFNDPIPIPNHAEQAVRLAIAMRDRAKQLQERWSKQEFNLGAGIGLAVGHATAGVVGFEKRMGYTAIGPVTNLASRLSSEARHGQIFVSSRFHQLVEPLVHSEQVGSVTLKGFHQPVLIYNVIGLKD